MRSEKEVYDIVLNFAKTDKRIRMVTLEGSRTNTNIPPDDFQDFDITFFVTDMDSFTSDDKWLDIFGERLILQKPEDMELFPAVEKGFSYLMLRRDLSRSVFAKQCAIRIDKQQKERYNNVVIDNDVII